MKKKIAMLLITAMAVGVLGACGSQESGDGTQGTGTVVSEGDAGTEEAGGTETGSPETAQEQEPLEPVVWKDLPVEDYVTLGDYKELEVIVADPAVNPEELEALVKQVYMGSVTEENGGVKDRAVENGDTVNIDYEGKRDGVAFEGGTAQGASLGIGSGQFIPGFEEGLIGVMPGETVDLDLTFPEGYSNAELAGAPVVFTVTVNYIVPTELKDEIVAGFGAEEYSNVEELNQYASDYLLENAKGNYEIEVENAIVNAFIESCTFNEIPSDLVDRYGSQMRQSMEKVAQSMGADADTYAYYYYGTDMNSFITSYAEPSVKQALAFQSVANAEDLNVDEAELDGLLEEYAAEVGMETTDELLAANSRDDYREYFMYEKVIEFLKNNATVSAS